MAWRAPGFRILVRPDPVEEVTKGGIILATDKRMEAGATQTGTVIDVGTEAFRSYNRAAGFGERYVPWCKPGDYISFARYAGKWIDDLVTKEELLMINDEDVTGVWEGELATKTETS